MREPEPGQGWGPCVCGVFDGGHPSPWRVRDPRGSCRRLSAMRLKRAGDSDADIARKLGVDEARVKQLLVDGGWRG